MMTVGDLLRSKADAIEEKRYPHYVSAEINRSEDWDALLADIETERLMWAKLGDPSLVKPLVEALMTRYGKPVLVEKYGPYANYVIPVENGRNFVSITSMIKGVDYGHEMWQEEDDNE